GPVPRRVDPPVGHHRPAVVGDRPAVEEEPGRRDRRLDAGVVEPPGQQRRGHGRTTGVPGADDEDLDGRNGTGSGGPPELPPAPTGADHRWRRPPYPAAHVWSRGGAPPPLGWAAA